MGLFKFFKLKLGNRESRSIPYDSTTNRGRWFGHWIDNDDAVEFVKKVFEKLIGTVEFIDSNLSTIAQSRYGSFIYIGHGNKNGVFDSDYFNAGIKKYFCSGAGIDKFYYSPNIWWACHSAKWLVGGSRNDWFGFKDIIGCDTRGLEAAWWNKHLENIVSCIINAASGYESIERLNTVTNRGYRDALKKILKGGKRSWVTVYFAKAFCDDMMWGSEFGGQK